MAGRRISVLDVREIVRRVRLKQSIREIARDLDTDRRTAGSLPAGKCDFLPAGPLGDQLNDQDNKEVSLAFRCLLPQQNFILTIPENLINQARPFRFNNMEGLFIGERID